ncbi:hypothetical protein [Pseudomonas sp. 5P_3.1_Bac2]|nr:hypothetical protein [Pseudomonas sp. 5P_3.1_Bac2]MCU1717479.1 hypothetical protein [Pseudomonas sp. 5P_3.1_Bac2]
MSVSPPVTPVKATDPVPSHGTDKAKPIDGNKPDAAKPESTPKK